MNVNIILPYVPIPDSRPVNVSYDNTINGGLMLREGAFLYALVLLLRITAPFHIENVLIFLPFVLEGVS